MEEILQRHASTIEGALSFLGIDPTASRSNTANQWIIKKLNSDILVFILLRAIKTPNGIQVMLYTLCELQEIPTDVDKEAYFHRMLELNHTSPNSCFSIYEGKLCLRSSRYAHGLEQEEAAMMIVDMLQSAHYIKNTVINPKKTEKQDPKDDDKGDPDIDVDMI